MVEAMNTSVRLAGSTVAPFKRILVLVAVPGSVSECLLHALEREFPWILIEQVENVEAACVKFEHPVSLILIEPEFLGEVDIFADAIARHHPSSITAVMYGDHTDQGSTFEDIKSSRTVRSALPMNLRLDLWLSVVRLLLRGGEYFPISFMHHKHQSEPNKDVAVQSHSSESNETGPIVAPHSRSLDYLTEREHQVLEMVSHGFQNKMIAAKFSLSEHTVKVHIHNIIKKLGAQNRTAAAAIFLARAAEAGTRNSSLATHVGQ
ncbi:LuxR C-terminal-related transcriptional regulator [Mesorhizobium sp. WSM2239]|uniref:LuxR C-terminal-related transcriptional regulator n=2 Tax=unclassified Mesorhizobium TaxID=325217 RepID=A0AAU8DGE2_9HYPH